MPGLDRGNFHEKLRVGDTVEVYGRRVLLYACDDATRGFFESLGVTLAENFEPPVDTFTATRVRSRIAYDARWFFEFTHVRSPVSAPRAITQLKVHKPDGTFHGVKSSSITRFLEASCGSQRDFSANKGKLAKADGAVLMFLLLWSFEEDGAPRKFKYW